MQIKDIHEAQAALSHKLTRAHRLEIGAEAANDAALGIGSVQRAAGGLRQAQIVGWGCRVPLIVVHSVSRVSRVKLLAGLVQYAGGVAAVRARLREG